MLEELDIKNFALIDSAHVDFSKGFTVLSGETGAGKSILIGSLAFLLGGKASIDQIRTGCHEASVSGVFNVETKEAELWLSEHGIEMEDGRILLRRVIRDTGKSSSWIGGVPVVRSDLSSFAEFLVDMHGQHEQQSLMKVSDHRRYLDIYADIVSLVDSFTEKYGLLVEKRKMLDELSKDEGERNIKIDMLSFSISEIDEAKLRPGEDDELEAEENKLCSFEKLFSEIEEITGLLGGNDESCGIVTLFRRLSNAVSHAVSLDRDLETLEGRVQSAFYEIDDISKEFNSYASGLVFDPARLSEVQDRLETINSLKKKYCHSAGASIRDILDYREDAVSQLEKLTGKGFDRTELENEISSLEKEVYADAKSISEKRKAASEKMALDVEEVLSHLGMKDTKFSVSLTEKEGNGLIQKCGPYGMDNIEFLIKPNPGSPFHPLAKTASGGELSRVMLALKTILSSADVTGTLVFDEIDTGIGGEVAVSLGEHMKNLSKKKQVLCITHLASIAVFADNQIKIQKGVNDNTTSTNVFEIKGHERVREIARMLSGDSDSGQSLEHAESMLRKYSGGFDGNF